MSDNHIMMVNIANLSSLAQSVFPDADNEVREGRPRK